MRFTFLVLASLTFLMGCKPSKNNVSQEVISYQDIAKKELGTSVDYTHNNTKEYVLCTSSTSSDPTTVNYLVVAKSTGEILVPLTKLRGKISWRNETQLAITEDPGHIKDPSSKPENMTYYFDVLTKKRVSANL